MPGAKSRYIWKKCKECGEEFIGRRTEFCMGCKNRNGQRRRSARRKISPR